MPRTMVGLRPGASSLRAVAVDDLELGALARLQAAHLVGALERRLALVDVERAARAEQLAETRGLDLGLPGDVGLQHQRPEHLLALLDLGRAQGSQARSGPSRAAATAGWADAAVSGPSRSISICGTFFRVAGRASGIRLSTDRKPALPNEVALPGSALSSSDHACGRCAAGRGRWRRRRFRRR